MLTTRDQQSAITALERYEPLWLDLSARLNMTPFFNMFLRYTNLYHAFPHSSTSRYRLRAVNPYQRDFKGGLQILRAMDTGLLMRIQIAT